VLQLLLAYIFILQMSENFRRISAEKLQSAAISAKNSKSRQNTADPNIGRFFLVQLNLLFLNSARKSKLVQLLMRVLGYQSQQVDSWQRIGQPPQHPYASPSLSVCQISTDQCTPQFPAYTVKR